jgi:hypothetical protein
MESSTTPPPHHHRPSQSPHRNLDHRRNVAWSTSNRVVLWKKRPHENRSCRCVEFLVWVCHRRKWKGGVFLVRVCGEERGGG